MKRLINSTLLPVTQFTIDTAFDVWPVTRPSRADLKNAKLVAHRGASGSVKRENQMQAFTDCANAGVWAIEFDIRWTKDQVPVVLHDLSAWRTFRHPMQPQHHTWAEVQTALPLLPSLDQVVKTIGSRCHMFIECKETLTPEREEIFLHTLKPLVPEQDYHLLTLQPDLLRAAVKISKRAFVLVSETNAKSVSRFVLEQAWGGVAGHYMLQNAAMIEAHHLAGQKVGVGFVTSFNNVCRQIARHADWMFSDQALHLQQSLGRYLDQP